MKEILLKSNNSRTASYTIMTLKAVLTTPLENYGMMVLLKPVISEEFLV